MGEKFLLLKAWFVSWGLKFYVSLGVHQCLDKVFPVMDTQEVPAPNLRNWGK